MDSLPSGSRFDSIMKNGAPGGTHELQARLDASNCQLGPEGAYGWLTGAAVVKAERNLHMGHLRLTAAGSQTGAAMHWYIQSRMGKHLYVRFKQSLI